MRTNMYDIVACRADGVDSYSWLTITDKSGNEFTAFVPFRVAQAMAEAFNAAQVKAIADA